MKDSEERIYRRRGIWPALLSAILTTLVCPVAYSLEIGVQQEIRQGLGPDEFDANKTTKYTVDVTSGNLYVKQTDLVIPSQRGPSIEVSRTYNSRNFDCPRLLGTANWSFSLSKYLHADSFYLCEDPGDFEDIESGDILEDPPEPPDCSDLAEACSDAQDDLSQLEQDIEDLEGEIEDAEDYLDWLYDNELPDAQADFDELDADYTLWEELYALPNCERDGWDSYPDCWMDDDLWDIFQDLGGNDGFAFEDEYWEADQRVDDALQEIADTESDISTMQGELEGLQGDWYELDGIVNEVCGEYEECENFLGGNFDEVNGFTFNDGDGSGIFIRDEVQHANQNSYHMEVAAHSVRLKDGTVYEFNGPLGAVSAIADRYNNRLTFSYSEGRLIRVTDSSGTRWVDIGYNQDGRISSVTDHTGRTVSYIYDGAGRLVTVRYPDNTETHYEYDEALLTRIKDANNHSIYFDYAYLGRLPSSNPWNRVICQAKSLCTHVWRDNGIGDTHYDYSYDPGEEPDTGTVWITDSRGKTTTKRFEAFIAGGWAETKKRLVTDITDPYGKGTQYTWATGDENHLGNLVGTTDTNGLLHEMDYDNMGNMLAKSADAGGVDWFTAWAYEPDFNQVTSVTDANNNTKYYYYADGTEWHGPPGVLWQEEDAEENETLHWYNDRGQKTWTEDANGNTTEYGYDSWGNLALMRKYGPITDYNPTGHFEATYTYDSRGNKIAETDFNGKVTEYSYDVMNRLTEKRVYEGGNIFTTHYAYDDVGNKITMTDPRGNNTQYAYDSADRLIQVAEPEERTTGYGYDTEGNKTSETDPNSNVTLLEYDALNRLIKKSEPCFKATRYYYNGSGDSSTDGGSRDYTRKNDRYTAVEQYKYSGLVKTYYAYDALYRLITVTDAMSGVTRYEYDPVGNKTAEVDAENRRTEYSYYPRNLLWGLTDPDDNHVVYTYDAMGNKASELDKNEHLTSYEYTLDRNLLTRVTDHLGGYVEYTYDGMNKRKERDKNGNITQFIYNARNLLTQTNLPIQGASITYQYDACGNKTLETDPNINSTHFVYDELNRMTEKTEAYGTSVAATTYHSYDPVGNRTNIQDAEGRNTHYSYDGLNRLTQVRDALQGLTVYTYDPLGNKIRTTDAMGHPTVYSYDLLNRLILARNPIGEETSYEYDGVGNRTDQWDANGRHIHYDYDNLNRLTLRTFEGTGVSIEYEYDAQGNRTEMNDSRAGMDDVAYVYNELNRVTDVTYSLSDKAIYYEYDDNGNRTRMDDPEGGETEYAYDALNRVDYLIDPDEGTTDYSYDLGSRITDMAYPNGTHTHYTYDSANHVTGMVTRDSSETVIQSIIYDEYDAVGNKLEMTDVTGTTSYQYDALYRLSHVAYPDDERTEDYEYDHVGNRTIKKVDDVITERYGYNQANQLLTRQVAGSGTPTREITVTGTVSDNGPEGFEGIESVKVNGVEATVEGDDFTAPGVVLHTGENTIEAVAKDRAGNTTSHQITVTYEPDITSSYEYGYDHNGNMTRMTKKVQGSPDEVTTYEYDYENRMTKVTLPNETTNEFTYDGDKRRISSQNAAEQVTKFMYDGINMLQEYDEEWEPTASYTQGIGIDKLIRRKDVQGARYFHGDALGSTRLMTKPDQSTAASYTYDAWGKITNEQGEATNTHKFTAREWDAEIKLQYNRARFYDPETGRFITQDPLTKGPDDPTVSYYSGVYSIFHRFIKEYVDSLEPDKTNHYVYCYNNPINRIDPLGLSDDEPKPSDMTPPPAEPPPPPESNQPPSPPQETPEPTQQGETDKDVSEENDAGKQEEDKKMPDKPEPVPAPCPRTAPTDTRSPRQEAVSRNLEFKGGLPQRGLAQELHETFQPAGKAADVIALAAVPFLFVPATAPAAAVAFGTASYAGSTLRAADAAVTKDIGKAALAAGEWFGGMAAGRLAPRLMGLESSSFNWGSMRYQSEATGRFVTNAAGKTYNAARYSAETAISVPFAVTEYKKPETP